LGVKNVGEWGDGFECKCETRGRVASVKVGVREGWAVGERVWGP
jgi:hypothetical protein